MMTTIPFALLLFAAMAGYALNRRAARAIRNDGARLHSISSYHGLFSALMVIVPVLTVILVWLVLQGPIVDWIVMGGLPDGVLGDRDAGATELVLAEIKSVAKGQIFGTPEDWKIAAADRYVTLQTRGDRAMVVVVAALALAIVAYARSRVSVEFRARQGVERIVTGLMVFASTVAIFTTVGIVLSLSLETYRFFQMVPLGDFLFGLNWEPQIPMREDQIAAEGAFGWVPVILGTMVITVVAIGHQSTPLM